MIERYSLPEMVAIWTEESKFKTWLEVELAACQVLAAHGRIPTKAEKTIRERANFDIGRINEIEAEVQHDVIAFLTSVAEFVGPASRYIHQGMTSSDVLDTALALQVRQAGKLIVDKIQRLIDVTGILADCHRYTVMIGRSHGIHAEPTTFGLKCAIWFTELRRGLLRMEAALADMRVGQISGAVGTCAHIPPSWESEICAVLGLKVAEVSNQVIQRDRHAGLLTAMAIVAATLEQIAVEIRHLQRTEVLEVEEPFSKGQKGSSAMPHKRNPIKCENVSGLARIIRANSIAALENIALWHERDISHSSVERIILPDSFLALDFMLARMTSVLEGLQVYPERMKQNMTLTNGLLYSQRVLLALTQAGVRREKAYRQVQQSAMECWKTGKSFKKLLEADADILDKLGRAGLADCFNPNAYLVSVDEILERAGIPRPVPVAPQKAQRSRIRTSNKQ